MKVALNDKVIAKAENDRLIYIEQNWYFPPDSAKQELFEKSPTPYTCPWKGVCQYWNVDGAKDAAWSYPEPYESAIETVHKDFGGYFAFDKSQVQFSD